MPTAGPADKQMDFLDFIRIGHGQHAVAGCFVVFGEPFGLGFAFPAQADRGFGAAHGLKRQSASPYILELLIEFERQGCLRNADFGFQDQVAWLLNEPSIHLQGVALRLRAMDGLRSFLDDLAPLDSDLPRHRPLTAEIAAMIGSPLLPSLDENLGFPVTRKKPDSGCGARRYFLGRIPTKGP